MTIPEDDLVRPMHSVHIPVMGTAFTIDTPIRVAPYGISSVISICDDELCETMRQWWTEKLGWQYTKIKKSEEDSRAKRITAYLNLVYQITRDRFNKVKKSLFKKGSDITYYFDMLNDTLPLKKEYLAMLTTHDPKEKKERQEKLRNSIQMGAIDVNIMTKLDRTNFDPKTGETLPDQYSDAISALRGYANSLLTESSVVFSAGFNRRLFAFIENCRDFFPDNNSVTKKRIILKVSDFRSSQIQGTFLAKKGLWIHEHRIESGLNCGGHTFPTEGMLLGPILNEFKQKRDELAQSLLTLCNQTLAKKGLPEYKKAPRLLVTVQGGIGTHEEDQFLLDHYQVDGTGWATPFLLVPEVTTVDDATREKLMKADQSKLYLSKISPLGVPFNTMAESDSEKEKWQRVTKGKAGSICPKGYLVANTEFTKKPICTASKLFQRLKLKHLESLSLSPDEFEVQKKLVYEKACLCEDLAAPALQSNKIDSPRIQVSAICPGPNLAYFSSLFSLADMMSHIYGRVNLRNKTKRSHMFINELAMYINYWSDQLKEGLTSLDDRRRQYFITFKNNLLDGITYYSDLIPKIKTEGDQMKHTMRYELSVLHEQLTTIFHELEPQLGYSN